MGDTGYYLLHDHHQHQGLLQSRDAGKCCFFVGHAKQWLKNCSYWPDNYFELWDIYDEFVSAHYERINAEKDELGRSINAVKGAQIANSINHAAKDDKGRSLLGVKNGERINSLRDENGKSVNASKGGLSSHNKKDEKGRSILAVQNISKANAQLWESTVDGFRGRANGVALHNKANGWDTKAKRRVI
jgi:hypothetical protein